MNTALIEPMQGVTFEQQKLVAAAIRRLFIHLLDSNNWLDALAGFTWCDELRIARIDGITVRDAIQLAMQMYGMEKDDIWSFPTVGQRDRDLKALLEAI